MNLDGPMILLLIIVATAITLAVFYYIIKAAVKWGILEAKDYKPPVAEVNMVNEELNELKTQYKEGKITFDEYQRKWIEASEPKYNKSGVKIE